MKNIKTIFIDLDGTLVGTDGRVSQESVKKLQELINKGFKIVISTGRNYVQAKKITKDIQGLWYITNNGACILDNEGKIISLNFLEKENFLKFVDEALKFKKLSIFIQNQEKIITNASILDRLKLAFSQKILKNINFKNIKRFFRKEASVGKEIRYVKNLKIFLQNTDEIWLKALLTGDKKAINFLKTKYEGNYNISFSTSENIEINSKNVSKGEAIKEFCKKFNIELKNTLCFGDSGNDIDMFKVVGIPVVMENSKVEKLHELSKYKAKSNENMGVYNFLIEYF